MSAMWVKQAFDGAAIAEVAVDHADSLARKLDQAIRCFADRPGWLAAYQRIEILRRLARLMEREFDGLAMLIALGVALKAARSLDASTVLVNDHTAFRTDWMPFAGRRQSGYGIGGIPYTMHDMTQEKMIVLKF
jgi:acyl-CoA reductase-like NAD-dependent aldehyde dehydrogenase